MKTVGILGGSFDPIHNGHLYIAQYLINQFAFSEIRFMPCKQPVTDKQLQTSTTQRLTMLNKAIKSYPYCSIDRRELSRQTPSYTQDSLISLRQTFPHQAIVFIMGSDVFAQLDTQWGENWQALIDYAHLFIIQRATQPSNNLSLSLKLQAWFCKHQVSQFSELQQKSAGLIYQADIHAPVISSTIIRQAISQGKVPQNMIPSEVLDYILQEALYCSS